MKGSGRNKPHRHSWVARRRIVNEDLEQRAYKCQVDCITLTLFALWYGKKICVQTIQSAFSLPSTGRACNSCYSQINLLFIRFSIIIFVRGTDRRTKIKAHTQRERRESPTKVLCKNTNLNWNTYQPQWYGKKEDEHSPSANWIHRVRTSFTHTHTPCQSEKQRAAWNESDEEKEG